MKHVNRRSILIVGLVSAFLTGVSSSMAAPDFPSRPIEVVVPYSPGGGTDVAIRLFKDKVEKILGQPLVSNYKLGAGGAIGTAFAAKAKPDGYTILAGSNSALIITPLVKKDAGYSLADFEPIVNLTTLPLIWAVKEDSPYKSMKDFIDAAKTRNMRYATYGVFTGAHLCMEYIGRRAGFEATNIPYKGGPDAMAAVLGGHADIGIAATLGMVGPGRLRMLAVGQERRLAAYPNVPSLHEMGFPVPGQIYFSLLAPKGTPKEITNKIYEAYKRVFEENKSEIAKMISGTEHTLTFLSPDELRTTYQAEYAFTRNIVKQLGALVE